MFVLSAACGPKVTYDSNAATMLAQSNGQNLFVPVSVNGGASTYVLLDTGAPQTLVPGLSANFSGFVGSLQVGPVHIEDYFVQGAGAGGTTTQSLVGFDVLCRYVITFDYHTPAVTIAEHPDHPLPIPFKLARSNAIAQLPATTIVVDAIIEGEHHKMAIDSGANSVVVRTSVAAPWIKDGRQVRSGTATTLYGETPSNTFRVHSLQVGDVTLDGVISGDGAEFLLDSDASFDVDGLIGGTFLRAFVFSVDYPDRHLALDGYPDGTQIRDEFIRLPISLERDPDGIVLAALLDTSLQSTLGAYVGQVVSSIDGNSLKNATDSQVINLVYCDAGSKHALSIDNQTLQVTCEDLLAL